MLLGVDSTETKQSKSVNAEGMKAKNQKYFHENMSWVNS